MSTANQNTIANAAKLALQEVQQSGKGFFTPGAAPTTLISSLTTIVSTQQIGETEIPLTTFTLSDGTPLAVFANASSPTFGLTVLGSKSQAIRWNNDPNPGAAWCSTGLPSDLDVTQNMFLDFLCSKSGATVGDATTLTVQAFLISPGDLYDAPADAGGVTPSALVGNAAAKTTALLTQTILAASLVATSRVLTFSVRPTAGLLGTDDMFLHECRLRYVRK